MSNPYAGVGTGATVLASARGDMGKKPGAGGQNERDDAPRMSAAEVVRRLSKILGRRAGLLLLAFAAAIASVIMQLYVPILTGQSIDAMLAEGGVDFTTLRGLLVTMGIVVVGAALTQWISGWLTSRIAYDTVRELRVRANERVSRLPLSYLDSHAHGDLLSRLVNDADQVGDGLLQGLNQLLSGVVTIVGTLVFMFSLSVEVGLVVVIVTPLSVLVAGAIARLSSTSFAQQQGLQGSLGGYVDEVVENHTLVSAFDFGPRAQATFDDVNEELRTAGEHAQFMSSLSNPSTRLVNNITYAVVALVGFSAVLTGVPAVLSIGQVQSFLSYANQYMKPFNEISGVVTQVQAAFASARRLFELLDEEPEPADAEHPEELEQPVRGEIRFEHVDFSYDKSTTLLQDICIDAAPGERVALVGPTGCGKTTLVNLLMRFYDPDAGRITLDGHDVCALRRADLRDAVGMVLQETWLIQGTVRDNIAYGKPGATLEEVQDAALRAHAHKFIIQLPHGYDTVVGGEAGILSQGQRQLLCIARVMLADPPVLILDEATSSIDTRTELQVQAAFDTMMVGRTSLVVAHRLSTIMGADRICVISGGHVIERGTHEELLAAGGFYANLYESQWSKSDEG